MHSSRSVRRAPRPLPRDKARKSPRRRPGARNVYPARLPRGARSLATDRQGGAPHRAAIPQRKSPSRSHRSGQPDPRRLGSVTTLPTPRPRMRPRTRGPPPASRPRAPESRSLLARAAEDRRGGGAAARAPPPQTPKLPSTPSTKVRSHRAAPRDPPWAEPEQLRALEAAKDNRRPLPRRRLGRGASTAVSTESKHLAAAPPAPRPPSTQPGPPAHALPADRE